MVRPALMTLGLFAAACAKPAPTVEPYSTELLGEAPRLPAPRAGSYARAPQRPQDPIVRAVVGSRTWDASLAGAAAGLALAAADGSGGFSRRELREQSWQAGYPWPVLALGVWKADEKAKPPPGLTAWIQAQPADRDLGVVRARGQGLDTWVGLAGRAQIDLGVIPRELTLGHALRLPPHAGARWRASDGTGALYTGDLSEGAAIALETAGEWLIQIYDEGGDLARFPVYINQKAPRMGVLPVLDKPVNTAAEARERAWQLLDVAREVYGSRPIKRDPILGEAADLARDADQRSLHSIAARYARVPERAVGWYCEAPTVEDCVDQLLWDPTTRAPFVDPATWAAGLSARVGAGGVALFGVAAGD